jgi:hypothetical protein
MGLRDFGNDAGGRPEDTDKYLEPLGSTLRPALGMLHRPPGEPPETHFRMGLTHDGTIGGVSPQIVIELTADRRGPAPSPRR